MKKSEVARIRDDGGAAPVLTFTRKSRTVLGDVPPNRRRTRASLAAGCADETEKAIVGPRRSGRLSITRETSIAAPNDFAQDDPNTNTQPAKRSRGRSKSVARKVTTKRKSAPAKPQPKEAAKQSRKRSRSLDVMPPPAPRVVARRSSEETSQKAAAKRARCSALETRGEEGLPQEHHNLAPTHFEPTKYTAGISPHDVLSQGNVLQTPEYVSDIFQRLYNSETHNSPHRYIQNQTHVNASMRAILVDWLVEVHMKFRLVPETLHLAVNIIDRYLTTVEVPRQTLQLVGVTSLLLAAKYEEIYPPEVKDCVCITDRAYTKQDILDMEADILNELSFNLTVPTGHPFLQRFLFITKASRTMESAAHYYAERMLQEHDALQFRPSAIAAAAVCLALNHPEIRDFDELDTEKPGVPQELVDYTGYSRSMILKTAEFVASKVSESVKTQKDRHLVSVKRKYAAARYLHISADFESPDAVDILDD